MVRKLLVAVGLLALGGAAAFWFLTNPEKVAASALPPRSPNLDNGRTMFIAGGCASCHAASKDARTMLGGGVALRLLAGLPAPMPMPFAPVLEICHAP